MNWYRLIKQAQLWNVYSTNFDEESLEDLLKVFYELEYKYSMVKNSNFTGLPQRQENILNKLRQELTFVSDQLLYIFNNVYAIWLSKHALLDPSAWANEIVESQVDLEYYRETNDYTTLVENLLSNYMNKITKLQPNLDLTRNYQTIATQMFLQEIEQNIDILPYTKELLSSYVLDEYKDMLEGDLSTDGLEEFSDQRGIDFKTEEQAEEHIFKLTLDDIDINDFLYEDQLTQTINKSYHPEEIIKELYEKLIFPKWYEFWQQQGIDETRDRIEQIQEKLKNASGTIEQKIVLIHEALNAAHQTGNMLDYISEYTEEYGINEEFLNALSNSYIEPWNQDLQQAGFNTNELV